MRFSSRSITCPRCSETSYHPRDIAEGYCGGCCWWTSHPVLGLAMVDGRHHMLCERPRCLGCWPDLDRVAS